MADTAVMDGQAPSGPAEFAYTNVRVCPCGRPLPAVPADQPGRRPRLCGRCKQTRRALTFIRAGARILERLRDPDYQGATDG